MAEQSLLFIDIKPHTNSSEGRAERPLWTRSDNNFRFNFLPDNSAALQETTSPRDSTDSTQSQISFTGQDSAFAFNFQIPSVTPKENMETTETPDSCSAGGKEEKISSQEEVNSSSELSVQSKAKKKKSGKSKAWDTEAKQMPAKESGGDTELTPEEQLNRQLDWCIEQLELGLRSQKSTPKQKEEASRALKTLRSTKAPLVKKRQVMRAMTGEYRQKMEEEKNKQFKLIQSEIASAHVKAVSDSPKKSVFHQRANANKQPPATEGDPHPAEAQHTDPTRHTQETTSAFVFTPSKENFCFNFF